MPTIKCLECGKEREVYPCDAGRIKYCNNICYAKHRKERKKECETCGVELTPENTYYYSGRIDNRCRKCRGAINHAYQKKHRNLKEAAKKSIGQGKLDHCDRNSKYGFLKYWNINQEFFKMQFGIDFSRENAIIEFEKQRKLRIDVAECFEKNVNRMSL